MHRLLPTLFALITLSLTTHSPHTANAGPRPGPLARIKAAAPACPAKAVQCFGIRLHVVFKNRRPVQTPEWIAEQLTEANTRYEGTGLGFELISVHRMPPAMARVRNKADRDRLGKGRYKRGAVDVFLVERLDNVDAPGEINGVHWRNRKDRRQRWIIMGKIAWHVVLAHELGHFFGLSHSKYPASIMNKSRDKARPPLEEWSFHEDEVATILERAKHMTRARYLADRRKKT